MTLKEHLRTLLRDSPMTTKQLSIITGSSHTNVLYALRRMEAGLTAWMTIFLGERHAIHQSVPHLLLRPGLDVPERRPPSLPSRLSQMTKDAFRKITEWPTGSSDEGTVGRDRPAKAQGRKAAAATRPSKRKVEGVPAAHSQVSETTGRNAFHWQGQPSIFTRKGEQRMSLRQVIENSMRHNHEATLGAAAGYTIGEKK